MESKDVVAAYFDALAIGDLEKALSLFSPEAKWCQPGNNQFAGIKNNLAEITAMFRGILNYTSGNLQVRPDGKMMKSGSLVAVPVWFTAKTESNQMNLGGLDLFEVENGKIIKVWTFSEDQYVDDKFFGQKKP